jgi:hypothetical protein
MCGDVFVARSSSRKNCDECKDPKSPSGRYVRIKRDAKRRRLAFRLTVADIRHYWQRPCTYCGEPTPTVNLDRVDSDYGYVQGNVVPCCPACNHLKGTFKVDKFLDRVAKIAAYQATRTSRTKG